MGGYIVRYCGNIRITNAGETFPYKNTEVLDNRRTISKLTKFQRSIPLNRPLFPLSTLYGEVTEVFFIGKRNR